MGMIIYIIDNRLYINVINKCINLCIFCIRNIERGFGEGYDFWFEKDLIVEEIFFEIKDL